MKLVANYNAVTIETAITAKDFKDIGEIKPAALTVCDEEGSAYFVINIGKVGGMNKNSIVFDRQTETGNMYVTVCDSKMPKETDKRRAYIEETFGGVLVNLAIVEQQVSETLNEFASKLEAVSDSINII